MASNDSARQSARSYARSYEQIAVIGLGYVGLPLAVALARRFDHVTGFDIDPGRIAELQAGHDRTGEVERTALCKAGLIISDDPKSLKASFYIVTVPTPITRHNEPDLSPLKAACELLGPRLVAGDVVVFESTVYPGVTEEFCAPLLAEHSGLRAGDEFKLGYSPERINPGDKTHHLEQITKIIAAQDEETLQRLDRVYGAIIEAGLYRAPSIKIAEAAKIIENTQRDLNIALMNELSLIFARLDIPTHEVLRAAATKWNFLPFEPGLVGGHCIGVDPYYLTAKAQSIGYHPELILAGRRLNDSMAHYVVQSIIKMLMQNSVDLARVRIAVMGLTFKENVPDLRNSQVINIVEEFKAFAIEPMVSDPFADHGNAYQACEATLCDPDSLADLDVIILAVPHEPYLQKTVESWRKMGHAGTILADLRARLNPEQKPAEFQYWSL